MSVVDEERKARRVRAVDEHIQCENRHDLDAVMNTFGETPQYHDEAWGEHYQGRNGVRSYYRALISALPDLAIDVKRRHITEEHVILEVVITGTHLGGWRGLPGTGRRVEFPLCAIYSFDTQEKLSGERIYYDRAVALRQVGLYREPTSLMGRLTAPLLHPVTITRVFARKLFRS
jgi:steroid delta-isomerase-like uncharacterized protein